MSKSILLPIHPEWCEKIFRGEKTIEVRKSKPKLKTPFKCYVYCTKDNIDISPKRIWWRSDRTGFKHIMNGKVIGELVVDEIVEIPFENEYTKSYDISDDDLLLTCLTQEQLWEYGKGKTLYGWHITDAKLYDKPRELSEFFAACKQPKGTDCSVCRDNREYTCKPLSRPSQSFCYVEELHNA